MAIFEVMLVLTFPSPRSGARCASIAAFSLSCVAVLLKSLMNSRRLMALPAPRTKSGIKRLSHFWIENCPFVAPKRQQCPLCAKSGHHQCSAHGLELGRSASRKNRRRSA